MSKPKEKPKGMKLNMSSLKAQKIARLLDEKTLLDVVNERFVMFCLCGERLAGGKPMLTIKGQSYKMLNMLLSALDYMIVESKDMKVMAHMGEQFETRANSLRAILMQAQEAAAVKAAAATTGETKNEQPQGETAAPAPADGQPAPEVPPLQPVQASGNGAGGAEVSAPDLPKQP
jgi:hypothetical protein